MTTAFPTRLRRLRDWLATDAQGADAFLVTSPVNVRYLTGFTGSNASLLVTAADVTLATDSRYVVQASQQCPAVPLLVTRDGPVALVAAATDQGVERLAFEAGHVTVAGYAALPRTGPVLVPTTDVVEELRIVKDYEEIAALRHACRITDEALGRLLPQLRAGLTERAIARRLEWLLNECGADGPSFDTIVAAGPNSAVPHHRPTDRAVQPGDLLKIDFGALLDGYHADETRTFVVGAPARPWQQELHDLVAAAQEAGRAALAAGADVATVDAAARQVIAAAGHADHFGHGLGHGVGLQIHEAPLLARGVPGSLCDRTLVTIEPGVYLPGRGGVRIEDTLLVTGPGSESLTASPRDLLVLG
ncbi:MAG: aminopeptidase P family protein [Actinomycetota bacterium]|nr:MAG: aminopeptidase P family protein [Actinomycetota bacterium]